MQLEKINTIEEILNFKYDKKYPTLYISKIVKCPKNIKNAGALRGYIKFFFRNQLSIQDIKYDVCLGVFTIGTSVFYCIYYVNLDKIDVTDVSSCTYMFMPLSTSGILSLFCFDYYQVPEISSLICFDGCVFDDMLLYLGKEEDIEKTFRYISLKFPNIQHLYIVTDNKMETYNIRYKIQDEYI